MSNDLHTTLTQAAQLKAARELERWEKATIYSAQKPNTHTTVEALPQRLVEGKIYNEFEVLDSGSGAGHHPSRTGESAQISDPPSGANNESIEWIEDDSGRTGAQSDHRNVTDEGDGVGRYVYNEDRVCRDNDDEDDFKPENNEFMITKARFLKTWAALEQDGQRRAWRITNEVPCRECVARSRTCWFERNDSITCVPCHKKRKKCPTKDDFGVFRLSSKLAVRRSWVRAMLKEGWHRQHRTVKMQPKVGALKVKFTRFSTAGPKKRPPIRGLKNSRSAAVAEVPKTQTVSMNISAPPRIAKVAALAVLKRKRLEHEKEEDVAHKKKAMVGRGTPEDARTDIMVVSSKWKVEDEGLGEEKEAPTIRSSSVQQAAETIENPDDVVVPLTRSRGVTTVTLHPALGLETSAGNSGVSTTPSTTLIENPATFASHYPPVKCLFNHDPAAHTKTAHRTSPVAQPPAEYCFQTPEIHDRPSPLGNPLPSYVSRVELYHETKSPVRSSVDGVYSSAIGEGPGTHHTPMQSWVETSDNVEPLPGGAIARYLRQLTDLRQANARLIEEPDRLVRSRTATLAEAKMSKQAGVLRREVEQSKVERQGSTGDLWQLRQWDHMCGCEGGSGAHDLSEKHLGDRKPIEKSIATTAVAMESLNPSGFVYNDIQLQIQQVEAECRRAQLEAKRATELANFWRGRALRVKLELCDAKYDRDRFLGSINLPLNTISGLLRHTDMTPEDLLEPVSKAADALREAVVIEAVTHANLKLQKRPHSPLSLPRNDNGFTNNLSVATSPSNSGSALALSKHEDDELLTRSEDRED